MGGRMKQVEVGRSQVWGINKWNEIWYREQCTEGQQDCDLTTTEWTSEPGVLSWIAASQKELVWGIGACDGVNKVWFQGTIEGDTGEWIAVPPQKMIKLDVGRDGNVVGLDENAEIWWRTGISPVLKQGSTWDSQGNKGTFDAFDVTICTTGNSFARGTDNQFYVRTGVRQDNLRGIGWTVMTGSDIQGPAYLTCGLNGDLWTLETTNGKLYRRIGVTRHDPDGDSW